MSDGPRRLYLGRLPPNVMREDITDLFRGLGRLVDVRVLSGFGFVEFDDARDAETAVRDFDGSDFMGERIAVEYAKQPLRRDDFGRGRDDYDRGGGYGGRSYDSRPPMRTGPRRGQFRLAVFNLPSGTSWQDLKDVGREHGQITYSDINRSRPDEGVLEFDNREDYERALARIEGTELRGFKLRVEPDGPPGSGSDRRERSPDFGRDRFDDRRDGDRWGGDRRPPPPMRDERDFPPRERDYPVRDDYPPRDDRDYPPRDDRDYPLRDSYPPRDDRDLPPRDDRDYPPRDDRDYPPREELRADEPREERSTDDASALPVDNAPAPLADEPNEPPADAPALPAEEA
ncbi:hypothetical protein MSPP1_002965 [Malassezia sp. CBS 17886]|nr:hypothetical protein MSPP1_002965 [Malassezia sp. CBS 17886]